MFFFFYDDVEVFLQQSLDSSRGETYEMEVMLNTVRVDYFLPNGCIKLNYPPCTVIEAIHKLQSGTVYNARRMVEKIRQVNNIRAFYIYCEEIQQEYLPLRSSKTPDDIVHVISFRELQSIRKPLFERDDYWKERRERCYTKAKDSFKIGHCTLVLGAGVSKSMGMPGWEDLLTLLLDALKQEKALSYNDLSACVNDSFGSLLVKARYLKRFYETAGLSLISEMRKALYGDLDEKTTLVRSLVALIKSGKIDSVITYNYDDLLEDALGKEDLSFTPVDKASRPVPGSLPILHIHGMIPRIEDKGFDGNVVLSEEDYHGLYNDAFHWANIEQLHAFTQTTCIFVGLSLKDPSIRRLLDIAYLRNSEKASHFAFLPRSEYNQPLKAETLFDRMGITVLWYEDVIDELPQLVAGLKN